MVRIILEGSEPAEIFHAGEREAHRRFDVVGEARELSGTIQPGLSSGQARLMAGQPFFFLSVREPSGEIHSQMVTCVQTRQGVYPLVAFRDAQHFCFLLRHSEGTRLWELARQSGCQAGAIFVDFARRLRLRVNGLLHMAGEADLPGFQCPAQHHLMAMAVQQAYSNCSTRIIRMQSVPDREPSAGSR